MRLTAFLGIIGCLSVIAITLLMPVFACGCKSASPAIGCMSNVKRQGTALLMYLEDTGDRYPNRDYWMDALRPYVKDEHVFHARTGEPEIEKHRYGYAFNGALSLGKPPAHPEKMVVIYDSLNPARNASDLVTSLPNPGRHKGKNHISYADGHVKAVSPASGKSVVD